MIKIKAMADRSAAALTRVSEKLKTLESIKINETMNANVIGLLKTAVTNYLKQAKNAVEMADGDAASALLFVVNAERSFSQIEKLIDELATNGSKIRDREIAAANDRAR